MTTDDQAALDRAAADMAVRDDLAREVARQWVESGAVAWEPVGDALGALLDRLAYAYGAHR